MKNLLIVFLSIFFLCSSCQSKPLDSEINIVYVGNYDFPMDIILTNYEAPIESKPYQSIYEVKKGEMINKVVKYILANHSNKTYRTNKLKVIVTTKNKKSSYYFNAEDGVKLISFLISNVEVNNSKINKYKTNQYFLESELPPFKNQLEAYSGREWMNEK